MIGNLSAPVDFQHGNAVRPQQMRGAAGESQRVDRRMLGQPDLVAGRGVARLGELLHRAPRRLVPGRAEATDRDVVQRTIATIGCATRSWYSASSCSRDVALTVAVSDR